MAMLQDQRIILIGASGDLGLALVRRFLDEGASVHATAHRHPERLRPLAETADGRLTISVLDVTSPEAMESATTLLPDGWKPTAIVFNAGVTADSPILGMEETDWEHVIDVNLNGAFRAARTFGPLLFRQRSGRMLFVSSVAGRQGGRGQANYAASKAGIEALVRSLAAEMAPRNVLVNAIAPGPIASVMTRDVMAQAGEELLRRIALRRLGKPEEIAAAAAHLLAPDMTFATGQVFAVDGGFNL